MAGMLSFSAPNDTIPFINSVEIFQQVSDLYESEEYDQITTLMEKIPESDTNYFRSRMVLLEVYNKAGKLEESKDNLKLLMDNTLEVSTNIYIQGGNLYLNNGDPEKAIAIYKKGLTEYPFSETLHYNIGYANYQQGRYKESLDYFMQVIAINPYYYKAHQMLGNLMAISNYRTRAMLSFMTSLAIEPDANWVLVRMNSLVNDAFPQEGLINLELDNSYFEYYDNLLRSRAVFDERYQTKVTLQAPVAQQAELLINKLKHTKGTDDFWMDFYVPFFEDAAKENLTTAFVNFILSSSKNEGVNDWLTKNTGKKDEWIAIANKYFDPYNEYQKRTILGKTKVFEHWFYDNGTISAIGDSKGEIYVGPWVYLHENGAVRATGEFNESGDKVGKWIYYYENGQLEAIENYNDKGELDGDYVSYDQYGRLDNEANYANGKLEGPSKTFFSCGNLKESYPYKNGVGNGIGKYYFETGELNSEYSVKEDQLDGSYTVYYKNGKIYKKVNYEAGKTNGKYESFYPDGKLYQVGQYKSDQPDGEWVYYHHNGNVETKGSQSEGKYLGAWEYFYEDGLKQRTENYNDEGEFQGESVWYDIDGKIHSRRDYKKDTLVSITYYDKTGKVISEEKNEKGNMPYFYYYPSGQLYAKGTLTGGNLNGEYITYHINGNVFQKGTMKDDQWDGEYQEFEENGQLSLHTTYKEGIIDGYVKGYYPDGTLQREGWFKNNNPAQKLQTYYPDGSLEAIYFYRKGERHGTNTTYDAQGKIFSENIYESGKVVKTFKYDSLGKVFQEMEIPLAGEIVEKFSSGETYKKYDVNCGNAYNSLKYYYKNGKVSTEYEMTNSVNNYYRGYNESGKVIAEGSFLNDLKDGEWKFYYPNGQLDTKVIYKNDLSNGKHYQYYENGQVAIESNYYLDELVGQRNYYAPSGSLQLTKHYEYNVGPVGYQYMLPDGTLSDTISIDQQKKQTVKAFYQNGKPSIVQRYDLNYYAGESLFYYETGQLMRKSSFKDGNLNGLRVEYYKSGQVKEEIDYYYNNKHGLEKRYHPNGKLKEVTNWFYDLKDGWSRKYDEQGKLLSEKYYRSDAEY